MDFLVEKRTLMQRCILFLARTTFLLFQAHKNCYFENSCQTLRLVHKIF